MTYCVGLCLRAGIIMLSDTRTNAGVDNISTFSKLQVIEQPGERVIVDGLDKVRDGQNVKVADGRRQDKTHGKKQAG